jgi:hypothetical protein
VAPALRRSKRLLVNFVYCHPVGHAIEALHYCHGYHLANPDAHIAVALNARSPVELAGLCPYIEAAYPITLDVFDPHAPVAGLDAIPPAWDWVRDDARGHQASQRAVFPGIAAYYDRAGECFGASGAVLGNAGATPPPYVAGAEFRLTLPKAALERAEALAAERAGGPAAWPRIAILPAGSGPRADYPSVGSWELVITSLARRWPEARFCLLGKLRHDDRTATSFQPAEVARLLALPRMVDAVDRSLIDQLAIVAGCDVLVAPHSGFAMAALAVGTPWLAISGNRWPEYYFNGVPFYSVLPDLRRFPALHQFGPDPEPVDDDGPRSPSMSRPRIEQDLGEIIDGVARLAERRWPYQTAMADHWQRMLELREGRADLLWSIDKVHLRYLTPPR